MDERFDTTIRRSGRTLRDDKNDDLFDDEKMTKRTMNWRNFVKCRHAEMWQTEQHFEPHHSDNERRQFNDRSNRHEKTKRKSQNADNMTTFSKLNTTNDLGKRHAEKTLRSDAQEVDQLPWIHSKATRTMDESTIYDNFRNKTASVLKRNSSKTNGRERQSTTFRKSPTAN